MEISWTKFLEDFKESINNSLTFYELFGSGVDVYFNVIMEVLQKDFGFTLIEGEENTGIILYSPDAQEIYREIPRTCDWKYNTLKSLTNYGN